MILNLTQHQPTPEQVAQGVENLPEEEHKVLIGLLNFEDLPQVEEIEASAKAITELVPDGVNKVMIGGAPFLMGPLQVALQKKNIIPLFAFSKRMVVEENIEGVVKKTIVFKHEGFVEGTLH